MPRDKEIRISFEVADDCMQAVIGYYFYVIACKTNSNNKSVKESLPESHIPVTLEWIRSYSRQNLMENMELYFDYYHARVCLVSVISAFEGSLTNFIERLYAQERISNNEKKRLQSSYKKELKWAFDLVAGSTYGKNKMQARVPELCLQVDHARRIRNLWMHNNGLINKKYADDSIIIDGPPPILVTNYQEYEKSRNKVFPVTLKPESFLHICLSHIELLHQLHYNIQKKYFKQKRAYSYKSFKKSIEWHRLLIGA